MAEQIIEVEAESLEQAREQLKSQIPDGLYLLSEQVFRDGKPGAVEIIAETAEEAFAKAQGEVPVGAEILEKKELSTPKQKVIPVEAFDEHSARLSAKMDAKRVGGEPLVVLIDRSVIGTIPEEEARTTGREFTLPDDTVLKVGLVYGQVQAWRNGQPLSPLSPAIQPAPRPAVPPKVLGRFRVAFRVIFFIAALSILLGIVQILQAQGSGVVTIGLGAIFLLLGFWVRRKSTVALGIAVTIYALDCVNFDIKLPVFG